MTPEFFFKELKPWMLKDFLDNLDFVDKNLWLTTRIQSLMYLAPWASKKLNQEDVFELPWDRERIKNREESAKEYQKQNIQNLENYINQLNK